MSLSNTDFQGIRTVESSTATIRFMSGVTDDDLDSSSTSSSSVPDMMSVSPIELQSPVHKQFRTATPPKKIDLPAKGKHVSRNNHNPITSAEDRVAANVATDGESKSHLGTSSKDKVDSLEGGGLSGPHDKEKTPSTTVVREDDSGKNNLPIDSTKKPSGAARFNPFDKDESETLDPFPQLNSPNSPGTEGYRSSGSWTDSCEDSPADLTKSSASPQLGIAEDHFSQPEGTFGLSTLEELELAISNCKQLILIAQPNSQEQQDLVHKLIQLRLKLTEAKDSTPESDPDVKLAVGHRFVTRESNSKRYCEQCCSVIWGVVQQWYRCTNCGFCCHDKCLNLVTRTCASVKVADNPNYILDICPERSLSAQNYKCAECHSNISFNPTLRDREPRQCDYNGNYYCNHCHWNDSMVIPARVFHNWDFEPRKVCRATKQLLRQMYKKAVIRVQDVNPMLFNFVEELNEVKKLREETLVMKKYFMACKDGLESKLLLQLKERQHFVENSDMYSLHDLVDTANDGLLPKLAKVHASFAQHIKTDCKRCQAKGYICQLCDEEEVLFPFDSIATVCAQCSTVLHRHCYMRRNQKCPKCERIVQRKSTP